MQIQVHPVKYSDVEAMRELYRQEANCQIIRDSFLARGLADPYLMVLMLYDCAQNITAENILFHDAYTTHLENPGGIFRKALPEDQGPEGEWVLEIQDTVVAAGDFLCHYNPPYGDIYMEVVEPQRRKGFGSYLVQELKRVCYEAGKKPAALCNPNNTGSRRTLEKAGLLPCGRLLAGEVKPLI